MGNVIHTLERRRENVKVADGQTYTEKWRRQGYFDCSLLYEMDPLLRIIHVTLSR